MKAVRKTAGRIGGALLVAVGAFFLVGRLHRLHWACELLCHFTAQYLLLLLIAAAALAVARRWRWAVVATILAAWNGALTAPIYFRVESGRGEPVSSAKSLQIASVDVLTSNPEHEKVIDWITSEQPDLVLLMEVNSRWRRAIGDLMPYAHIEAREDNFGMAMLNRAPFAEVATIYPADGPVPAIRARVADRNGKLWTVYGCHPLPPVFGDNAQLRNEYLEAIGRRVVAESGPTIVIGDLNATSWSGVFTDFLDRTKLVDSRRGFGVQPTWSPRASRFFLIPIDHCLVSAGIIVNDRRVGPDIGSDHFPIVATLSERHTESSR